ncbi:MAG: hypothetical protein GX335_01425 [Firmicutes bacterium]|nr:hypothetical protein [Bacillota bacterium]
MPFFPTKGFLSSAFQDSGAKPVVAGGQAVQSDHAANDLDLVTLQTPSRSGLRIAGLYQGTGGGMGSNLP